LLTPHKEMPQMAKDVVKNSTPKDAGFVTRGANYAAKQAKLEKEEAELAELMSSHYGKAEPEKEVEDEVVVEAAKEAPKEDPKEGGEGESDDNLSREEASFKKRYGDLRRHMANKEKEWEEKLEKSNTNSPAIRAPKSDEDIEAWAIKNPDVAAIVETIAAKKANEKFAQAEGRLKDFDDANYEVSRTKSETTIRAAHPDFDKLRDSDEFHDWVEEQPKVVQDALYINSDDPASVIRVLDLYKVDNGMTPSARKEKAKDAAKVVKARSRTVVDAEEGGLHIKESDVAKMSDKQFEDSYDDINTAMQTGKFVYDVSGRAR